MSKPKTSLLEPDIDNRLLDDRGPTHERLAGLRGRFAVGDTGVINLRVNQSPIERAVARGTISEQHGKAAAHFYFHWRRGGCASLGTTWRVEPWSPGYADSILMAKTELESVSRRKIRRALQVIHEKMDHCGMSRDAIKLLFSVVCDERPFEISGKLVWPRMGDNAAGARAITYVRGALRVLTIEWGL